MENSNTTQFFFEKVLQAETKEPIITDEHKRMFREVDDWLKREYPSVLLISGPTGRGKSVLTKAIIKILITEEFRQHLSLKVNMCCGKIVVKSAADVIRAARLGGREAFLYGVNDFSNGDILILDNIGARTEETEVSFEGWDKSRRVFTKEKMRPIEELLEYRLDKDYTTIITTRLNSDEFEARYGEVLADKLYSSCLHIYLDFKKSFRL